MDAAVLRRLGKPPRYEQFPEPIPGQGEVIVHVRAASLKPVNKQLASGAHYASPRELPVVCGSDGVGNLSDGKRGSLEELGRRTVRWHNRRSYRERFAFQSLKAWMMKRLPPCPTWGLRLAFARLSRKARAGRKRPDPRCNRDYGQAGRKGPAV